MSVGVRGDDTALRIALLHTLFSYPIFTYPGSSSHPTEEGKGGSRTSYVSGIQYNAIVSAMKEANIFYYVSFFS